MFFDQNKRLVLGAAATVAIWFSIYWLAIQDNWATAQAQRQEAITQAQEWEKYFKGGVPKPEAEKALDESNGKLQKNIDELKKIEFGTPEALIKFTELAAGTGDHKNYFDNIRTQLVNRSKSELNIPVSADLGIGDKAIGDPVSINLLRLALVDRFLTACKEANVPRINKIQHESLRVLPFSDAEEPTPAVDDKKHAPLEKVSRPAKLVQLPMRVTVALPEQAIGQLLFELQKPSDASHGYFCIRGFHVLLQEKDKASGMVEATFAVSALFNQEYLTKMGVQLKTDDEHSGGRKPDYNLERGY